MENLDPSQQKPRRFHGYTMLGVAVAMAAASMPGQTVLMGLFNEPIGASLGYDEATAIQRVSESYTIATIAAGFLLPFIGRAADRFGLRWVVGFVTVFFAAGLLVLSRAESAMTVTAGFFLARLFGQGAMGMLAGHTAAMWFERRLGTAHAVIAMGFTIPSALSPVPTQWLIDAVGWRNALPILAGIVLVLVLPLVFTVFRNKPEDIGQHLDGDPTEHAVHDVLHGGPPPQGDPGFTLWQAMTTRAFWILLPIMAYAGTIGTALMLQMKYILTQGGADPSRAAITISSWAVALAITHIIGGRLADSVRPSVLLSIAPAFGALGCGCVWAGLQLEAIPIFPAALAGMGVFGVFHGLNGAVANPTLARYFGRTHHGAIRGAMGTAIVVGTGLGPVTSAWGYNWADENWAPVMLTYGLLCLPLVFAAMLLAKPTPPKNPEAG